MEHIYFEAQLCSKISTFKDIHFVHIEVRDSRTGYLVPGRDGLGVWADGRVVGTPPSPPLSSPPPTPGSSG